MPALLLLLLSLQDPGRKVPTDWQIVDLRVEITTARTNVDPSDLLSLDIRWINGSESPVKLHVPLLYRVFMEEPGGQAFQARTSFGAIVCGKGHRQEFGPGQFMEMQRFLSPSFLFRREGAADRFRPPSKGVWKVWVESELWHGVVKSNVVEFRIEDDPARSDEVRRTFGSEAWHRFALGDSPDPADLLRFRKVALGKTELPQKDIMAYMVGRHDLNRNRPGHALTLLRIAGAAKTRNVSRHLVLSDVLQCHWELGNLDEALLLMDQFRPDPADIARWRWDETRAGIHRRVLDR